MEQLLAGDIEKWCFSFQQVSQKMPFCHQSQTAIELMFIQHIGANLSLCR